jgi:hypothetical protein
MKAIFTFVLLLCASTSFAAGGAFQIYNNKLSFPDGSEFSSAPKDGKTIYNGSGVPGFAATVGDFYLDTLNKRLYGPYGGSWGGGVSIIGPQGSTGSQGIQGIQGLKGDTGISGPSGATGISSGGVCGLYASTATSYMETTNWAVMNNTSDVFQLFSFYGYPLSNILGINNNIGVQFASGTSPGLVVFYFLRYDVNGNIDNTFAPVKVGGGYWQSKLINGKTAIVVDFSSVRYAQPVDVYFTANGNNIYLGEVIATPSPSLSKSMSFTSAMVSGKTVTFPLASGMVSINLASNFTVSGTSQDGSSIPTGMTWAVDTLTGILTIGPIKLTIVGGTTDNCRAVTYTATMNSNPNLVVGPVPLKIM